MKKVEAWEALKLLQEGKEIIHMAGSTYKLRGDDVLVYQNRCWTHWEPSMFAVRDLINQDWYIKETKKVLKSVTDFIAEGAYFKKGTGRLMLSATSWIANDELYLFDGETYDSGWYDELYKEIEVD